MYRAVRRSLAAVAAVGAIGAGTIGVQVGAAVPASAASTIPYQAIAKNYTEGLGRAPDQSGWTTAVNHFATNGCSASTLSAESNRILTSSEFNGLALSNPARVEVAYRTLLNREPDSSGYGNFLNQLNGGASFQTVLNGIEASPEYSSLAGTICSSTEQGFGATPAMSLSPTGSGFSGSEASLQAALNAAGSGGTVYLQSRTVVSLTSTLTIPAGVTLTTTGAPSVTRYAEMGRLSRSPGWLGESIHVSGGAKLKNVWVDGDRNREGDTSTFQLNRYNMRVYGGTNTVVADNRIGNTAGATDMELEGADGGYTCTSMSITGNLIDAYTSRHSSGLWSDGISNGCENATITNNSVLDASDVGIISFAESTGQNSVVQNNTVIQAGHGAFAILASDPSTGRQSTATTYNYANAKIQNNTLWSAPTAPSTFGIADGTYGWFGPTFAKGSGTTITGNSAGSLNVYAEVGIVVSGMLNTTVDSNSLNYVATADPRSGCPQHPIGASVSQGWASGSIPGYVQDTYSQCINSNGG